MIKLLKKMNLAIAIVLSAATTTVAQFPTVTVPPNCIVVSTNLLEGGVLGAGGKVTPGGVVTMPDAGTPNGGTFTFSAPNIASAISWSLSGDLSNTPAQGTYQPSGVTATVSGTFNAPTQPPTGTSATIISYNKTYRQSEGVSPSNPSWARSKGRVSVSYKIDQLLCPGVLIDRSLTFDVFKTYTASPINNVPKIVGPTCVKVGVPCTFSVDQIASDNANDQIGFDKYYWTGLPVVEANSIYYSADNSSITFIPSTSTPFTLRCCYGQANPWNGGTTTTQAVTGTTCVVTPLVGILPSEPTVSGSTQLLSTVFPRCVPTGTGLNPFTISYNSPFTCTWTMPNTGWTIASQTSSSVTINTNGFNNPGLLVLTVTNGSCTPFTTTYQVNRSFTSPSVAIAPVVATNTCVALGSSNNLFAISPSASANPTTWTINPTLPIVPSSPNSTVAVNVPSTASAVAYTLTAKSTACAGNITYQFRVRPNVPTITGSNCIVKGSLTPQTYTCVATPGVTNYTWVFPAGWNATTTFTTSTNTITVTPSSATAVLNGTVTVTANGIAGCNNSANFTITYASQAPTGVQASCFSVGTAGAGSVTFTNPLPGNYTATMISTAGGTNVIQGNVTPSGNTLTFNTSALTAGTYNITITHNSGCGTPSTSTTQVTVNANSIIQLNPGSTQDQYVALTGIPFPQYEWQTCTSVGVCSPIGTNSFTLTLNGTTPPPAGNQVCVTVYSLGSTCKTRICTNQGTFSRPLNTNESVESIEGVSIFPNPNSGNFNIKIADFKKEATATLYDFNGKKIQDYTLTKGVNNIENESLAKGTYILFISVDDKTEAKQIVIK
jgi:hypothetical protein